VYARCVFYAAVVATLIAAFKASRAWGRTAALVFAALNGLVILVFPAGRLLGLIAAGTMLMLLRESEAKKPKPPGGDAA
jgi:hypothetical protein